MKRFAPLLAPGVLVLLAGLARAEEATPDDLKRQRAAADATYEAAAAKCQARFAVSACEDRVREAHRLETSRLRAIELDRSDAKRKQRVQAHAAQVQAREARAASAGVAASAPSAALPSLAELVDNMPTSSAGPLSDAAASAPSAEPKPRKPAEPRSAATQNENREKFDERQRKAADHREHMERRNAEREQHGKKATPLPVPASAASAP